MMIKLRDFIESIKDRTEEDDNHSVNLIRMCEQIGQLRTELMLGNYNFDTTDFQEITKIVEFCQTTGTKLSLLLDILEKEVIALAEIDELMEKALAGPKMTQKVLRYLPIVAISLGFFFGSKPWEVYSSPVGLICLLIGAIFWFAGGKIIKRKTEEFEKIRISKFDENPVVQLTLVKAGVLSGLSILSVFEYLEIPGTKQLVDELPFQISGVPEHFKCLEDSFIKGHSPIGPINAKIHKLKMESSKRMKVMGEELVIQLIVPLGACYLPSFIFIGIIPTIIGMASGTLG
jgi:tight adherence protein B